VKILVVEDHPFLADITCMTLRELHGHEVEHVATAAAALAAAAERSFDLALLDIGLPDEDGYQLATKFRKLPHLESMIIVAVTGVGSDVDPNKAANAGIDASFEKPMDFKLLPELRRTT
jgi:DNA-binding response OmpR family regulator